MASARLRRARQCSTPTRPIPKRLAFSGDVNNVVHAHRYKIYAPDEPLLRVIVNGTVKLELRFDIGRAQDNGVRLDRPGDHFRASRGDLCAVVATNNCTIDGSCTPPSSALGTPPRPLSVSAATPVDGSMELSKNNLNV